MLLEYTQKNKETILSFLYLDSVGEGEDYGGFWEELRRKNTFYYCLLGYLLFLVYK